MPDKASRTTSTTPHSDRSVEKKNSVDSIELLEDYDDEGFDDEEGDETRDPRVRFKVRGLLTVINHFPFPNWPRFLFSFIAFRPSSKALFERRFRRSNQNPEKFFV